MLKAECFSHKISNKANICSYHSFNVVMKVLPTGIKQEKNRSIQIGKEEKLLVADDVIIYRKSWEIYNNKKLELINEFKKIVGYNVNIQKSWLILDRRG